MKNRQVAKMKEDPNTNQGNMVTQDNRRETERGTTPKTQGSTQTNCDKERREAHRYI